MGRCRTFRYSLRPTVRQTAALDQLRRAQCELYNAALDDRRGAWRWEKRSVSYVDQCRTLTELRDVRPEVLGWGVTVCRGSLKRLDRAFQAFYRRCKAGEKPGYPRFRSVARFDSVQWEDTNGWRLDDASGRLHLQGIGAVKVRLHRPIRGTPKAITVARQGRRWYVSIRCVDVPAQPLPATGKHVGIDLGVGVLVATSDGLLVEADRPAKRAQEKLATAQRALQAKVRGSNRRQRARERVGRCHRRIRNQRADTLHQLSRSLVNDYDLIVHEALRVRNMVRRPRPRPDGTGAHEPNGARAKAGLNRSISDAGWGTLVAMLTYKAEDAGRTVVAVDPRHTSRTCSACGHVSERNRRGAVFECEACGHQAHADTNAACNILRAGRARQPQAA